MPAAAARSAVFSRYGLFDYALGGIIILTAVAFLAFIQIRTGTGSWRSYSLTVQLADAGGLRLGSDVRLSGIKVGSVSVLSLGPQNRFALAQISLRDDLALPIGSTFSVVVSPMSDPYLSIRPGRGPVAIPPGSLVGPKPKPAGIPAAMGSAMGVQVADFAESNP